MSEVLSTTGYENSEDTNTAMTLACEQNDQKWYDHIIILVTYIANMICDRIKEELIKEPE